MTMQRTQAQKDPAHEVPPAREAGDPPRPAVRRPSGLYVLLAILVVAATVQATFIAYLHFGVNRGVNQVLEGLATSPVLQEIERLQQHGNGSTEPRDPNRFYVPPEWDEALSDDQKRPPSPTRLLPPADGVTFIGFPGLNNPFDRALKHRPLRAPDAANSRDAIRAEPVHAPSSNEARASAN